MSLQRAIGSVVLLAMSIASLPVAFGARPAGTLRDITYSVTSNGVPLYLDAQIPEGPGPFPAVIIVHGGGWVRGSRSVDPAPLFQPLERAGIAWFSIDYQLMTDVLHFGSAVGDVRDAISFVKSNAAEYRIDPERIGLIGESAGGQLAAMAALDPRDGTRVKAVVAMYTPTDLVTLARESDLVPPQIRKYLQGSPFEALILGRLAQLSPVDNIKPDAPPFLLIHGTADRLVPFSQSTVMCERLKAAGVGCELFPVDGAGHGMRWWEGSLPREAQAYKAELVRWLKKEL